MKTELELLQIAIKMTSKNKSEFAEKIGMTRQNLNKIEKKAEAENGMLRQNFVLRIKKMYDVDIYEYQDKKNKDYPVDETMYPNLSEPEISDARRIISLLDEKEVLKTQLKKCEDERDKLMMLIGEKNTGRRYA